MITSNIRVLFQDIDGCLNPGTGEDFGASPDWHPSPAQIEMLETIDAAIEASPIQHFVFNTGRPWSLVHYLAEHIRSPKLRYFLLEHACVLYDRATDCYLNCAEIAKTNGLHALAGRYENLDHLDVVFEWYRKRGRAELENLYKAEFPPLDKVGNLSFEIPKGVEGDALLAQVETIVKAQLPAETVKFLDFLRSDRYIDILPGIHKLDGIYLLTAHLGIELTGALAMGDYLNDLQIFETFPRVLCPANSHEKIRALTRSKREFGHLSAFSYGEALLDFLKMLEPNT